MASKLSKKKKIHIVSPLLSPYLPVVSIKQTPTQIEPLKDLHHEINEQRRQNISVDIGVSSPFTTSQWIIYIIYCLGFFSLGLFTSAPGPILKDFESQVGVSLSIISFIFTARAIGFFIGSIISGYVLESFQNYILNTHDPPFKYYPKQNQSINEYLSSLPKISWPLSPHNVFSISMIIAGITMFLTPYAHNVWYLAVLVTINGICFGNVNTFGNVCLLTLFDTKLDPYIDLDIIYGTDTDTDTDTQPSNNDDDDDENDKLLLKKSYGSINNDPNDTMMELKKEDERVGPYMQGLQAIYALGGFLAPLFIQISFEISNSYKYSFFLFTIIFIPIGIALFYYPTPIRLSIISKKLKQVQLQKIASSLNTTTTTTATANNDDDGGAGDNNPDYHGLKIIPSTETKTEPEIDIIDKLRNEKKKKWKVAIVIGFALFLCWYVGGQVGYGMYVTTYSIDYLNTSASVGRLLASANWFGLFIGRFIAIPLSKYLSSLNMICMDLIGIFFGCFILFFSAESIIIVWISSISVGFFMSSVWPCMFVWAETLFPVSGTFASIMVGGGSLGEFLIPAAQGNIMSYFGEQYFAVVMFIISIFLIIHLLINNLFANKIKFLKNKEKLNNIKKLSKSTLK